MVYMTRSASLSIEHLQANYLYTNIYGVECKLYWHTIKNALDKNQNFAPQITTNSRYIAC